MNKKYNITNTIPFIIITIIFLIISSNALAYLGKEESGRVWCENNMGHLTNLSYGRYWMIFRDDGFPNSCCSEGGYRHYERDQGTMNYFLFGKNARYMDSNCNWVDGSEWGESNYGVYEEPNKFGKILLGFKYIKEMGS